MRIIFAGTPDFAAITLAALLASPHHVAAVLTQPDRPAGRGKQLVASPVKQLALQHDIPVLQPLSLKADAIQQQLVDLGADVMVVVAYGLIIPQAVLDIPPLGCLNVHASLLPRWRGAAPIQRAIAAGDTQTGVTIMQMDAGLDTGDMLLHVKTPIDEQDTGGSLHDRLAQLGAQALLDALSRLPFDGQPQDDNTSCYATKLTKQEARIDWSQPSLALFNLIRAFNPWPVCHTTLEDGTVVRIWQANRIAGKGKPGTILQADKSALVVATGDEALQLESIQLPGKRPMPARDVINGNPSLFVVGKHLGLG